MMDSNCFDHTYNRDLKKSIYLITIINCFFISPAFGTIGTQENHESFSAELLVKVPGDGIFTGKVRKQIFHRT